MYYFYRNFLLNILWKLFAKIFLIFSLIISFKIMFDIWYFCGWQFSIFVYVFFFYFSFICAKTKIKINYYFAKFSCRILKYTNIHTLLYVLFLVVRKKYYWNVILNWKHKMKVKWGKYYLIVHGWQHIFVLFKNLGKILNFL